MTDLIKNSWTIFNLKHDPHWNRDVNHGNKMNTLLQIHKKEDNFQNAFVQFHNMKFYVLCAVEIQLEYKRIHTLWEWQICCMCFILTSQYILCHYSQKCHAHLGQSWESLAFCIWTDSYINITVIQRNMSKGALNLSFLLCRWGMGETSNL